MAPGSRFAPATLLRLAQQQDPNAFSELVDGLRPRIDAMLLSIVRRGRSDREDVLQESLLHAFHSLYSLRVPTPEGFVTWLGGIVRNRLAEAHRRNRELRRPRLAAALPWSLARGVEPELLLAIAACGEDPTQTSGVGAMVGATPLVKPDRRLALVLHDGFGSTLDLLNMVFLRRSDSGTRRSLRATRLELCGALNA